MAIATGTALALSALAAGGVQTYGAHKASKAADRATDIQRRSDEQAFELERLRDEEDRRRWEAEQDFMRRQWDAQETRLEPYRRAGADAIGRLSGLLSPEGQMRWRSPSRAGYAGKLRGLI